jgi:anion-transporting  ArsA/GET3 family ATPase
VLDVDALLDDPGTRVIVCCGAGGVGKTTTAAALALRAAERGRRVVVLTIDPARRLAQSMGLVELDNTPRPVQGVDETGGGRAYLRVVSAAVGSATGVLTKLLGAQILKDVQAFVAALDTVFGGFRERASRTYELLQAPGTAFVVVAAPERDALREASYFVDRLAAESMPLAGLVLNRVHTSAAEELSASRALTAAEDLEDSGGPALVSGLLRVHADRMVRRDRERALAGRFTAAFPRVPVAEVAARAQDVHDLEGLRDIGSGLAKS